MSAAQIGLESQSLSRAAVDFKPLFGIVGGDLAYANGIPACYRRWDQFLREWSWSMHYTPLLVAVGNHDASQYFHSTPQQVPMFLRYFPQATGLAAVEPQQRKSFHAHSIGPKLTVLALDSGVLAPIDGEQERWMRDELAKRPDATKIVVYHYPLYPAKPHHVEMDEFVARARSVWGALFDQYNVTFAFENHFHVFKKTPAIYNNKVVGNSNSTLGTTYLGDGAWGISGGGHAEVSQREKEI